MQLVVRGLSKIVLAAAASLAVIISSPSQTQAAAPLQADLYVLSIGSGDYLSDPNTQHPKFESSEVPVNSATRVANALNGLGVRRGILLISDHGHPVGVDDIHRAITDLKHMIRKDQPANPVIILYYMGHGLGDAYSQTLYMVPGNFQLTEEPTQISTLKLIKILPLTSILFLNLILSACLLSWLIWMM